MNVANLPSLEHEDDTPILHLKALKFSSKETAIIEHNI